MQQTRGMTIMLTTWGLALLACFHTLEGAHQHLVAKSNGKVYGGEGVVPPGLKAGGGDHQRVRRQAVADHGMTTTEIQIVVDEHNKYRRMENAADMHVLRWNDDLARSSKDWAILCQWKHGQADLDLYPGLTPPLGQNLYLSTSPQAGELHVNQSLFLWWDEKKDYDYDTGACSGVCGHYTQMVWANSREVGCAYTVCDSITVGGQVWNKATYVVCNYSPAGNYVGQKPYTVGSTCSGCLSKFGNSQCVNGLCDSVGTTTSSTTTTTTPTTTSTTPTTTTTTPTTTTTTPTTTTTTPTTTTTTTTTTPTTTTTTSTTTPTTTTTTPTTTTTTPTTTTTTPTTTTTTPTTTTTTPTTTTTTPTTTTTTPTTTTPSTTTPTTTTTTTASTSTTTKPTVTTGKSTTTPTTTRETTTTTMAPTTTPTSTTTTPASTPTTTTATTTTAGDSSPCSATTCQNGGTGVVSGDQCACTCTPEWEGDACQDNVAEAQFSIVMVAYPIRSVMQYLQQTINIIKQILSSSLNARCRAYPSRCCGVSTNKNYRNRGDLSFTSEDYISVAQGYPRKGIYGGYLRAVFFRMLAKSAPGNSLCAAVREDLKTSSRMRRDVIGAELEANTTQIPQEFLYEAAREAIGDLEELLASLNITLQDVMLAGHQPHHGGAHTHGLPVWAWPLIGIIAILVVSQVVVYLFVCRNRKSRQHPAIHGTDNMGFSRGEEGWMKQWFYSISSPSSSRGSSSQAGTSMTSITSSSPLKMAQSWDPYHLYGRDYPKEPYYTGSMPLVTHKDTKSPHHIGYPHHASSPHQVAAHIPRVIVHQGTPVPDGQRH